MIERTIECMSSLIVEQNRATVLETLNLNSDGNIVPGDVMDGCCDSFVALSMGWESEWLAPCPVFMHGELPSSHITHPPSTADSLAP